MKRMGDMLTRREPFSEIVMGNTAVARAMVDTGIRVITSYPGSPTPEIAAALASIPKEDRPFHFEFSTNEKVATEVAFGAAINGHTSCVFFKSVGLNVAADSFVQLSMMEIIGGLVVVVGDDPGANSSQNEQDNRHFARMTYMPVLEPATPSEAYRMMKAAVAMAREHSMAVMVRLTTHVCHYKELVQFDAYESEPLDRSSRFDPANGPYVPVAATVFPKKRRALERLEIARKYANTNPFLHRVDGAPHTRRGIITAGLPFYSLLDCLEQAPGDRPDVLYLGMVHPIPQEPIANFLEAHDEVKILEELDDFLEQRIKALAFDRGIRVRIHGKTSIDDWMGEYVPGKVWDVLRETWPDLLPEPPATGAGADELAPSRRPPQLCPGCGHRSAFYAVKQALKDTDITVGDIGCHTLGYLPPYEVGQVLLCMGHSMGTAAGLSLWNDKRKVVAFLGDSTLYHAGLPGIINAFYNNHNVTLVIMDNGTTAMTGHQGHPGSGNNFAGKAPRISIEKMLEGLGIEHVAGCDAYAQAKLRKLLMEATEYEGLSVVIARHPCMLKFTRERRRKGLVIKDQVYVDPSKCDHLHHCVADFGCPSFQRRPDGSVEVNKDLCIGDGSCLQTCPVSAISLKKGADA